MIPSMSKETLGQTYRRMLLMRRFEEACIRLWHEKVLPGHYHVYIGQEATGAAVGACREAEDYLFTTHRNHGHLVACGADPGRVLAEILARSTGYNHGRGGTLHVAVADLNIPHTSALVGSSIPIASGAALALKQRRRRGVSVALFGDGALEEGVYYETANIAALWKLPLLLICENNTWDTEPARPDEYPSGTNAAASNLAGLATCFGIPAVVVDGTDLGAVHAVVAESAARARDGGGPTFIEARTRRWIGTRPLWPRLFTGEMDVTMAWTGAVPAERAEHTEWYLRDDPVLRVTRELLGQDLMTTAEVQAVDREVQQAMAQAVVFATAGPVPDAAEALSPSGGR